MSTKREEKEAKKRKKDEEQAKCIDFIREYRLREALWNTVLPEYHNQLLRSQLTGELLVIYNEWHPDASKSDMMSKLNTLKTTYRTERKKVLKSEKSGTGTADVYEPKWYCYRALDAFMQEASCAEPANKHRSSINEPKDPIDDAFDDIRVSII